MYGSLDVGPFYKMFMVVCSLTISVYKSFYIYFSMAISLSCSLLGTDIDAI